MKKHFLNLLAFTILLSSCGRSSSETTEDPQSDTSFVEMELVTDTLEIETDSL
jgi:hypothetical protein